VEQADSAAEQSLPRERGEEPEGPERMSVYFITARELGRVKIGFTAGDPDVRRAALQVGCPSRLRLEAVIPGHVVAEAELHHRFADHRIVGEWFALTDDIEQIIAGAPAELRTQEQIDRDRAAELLQFVERIETLDERLRILARELAATYAEAKAAGFDKSLIKHLMRIREMNPAERAKLDSHGLLPVYSQALMAA
jgi:uncharacterized protein (UPF0335 family)